MSKIVSTAEPLARNTSMTAAIKLLRATLVVGLVISALPALAQDPAPKASHFLPIPNEPEPKLHVDPPLAEPLARGAVIIPYRIENLRILPIFGAAATGVSPRAGHLHVTVDDLPWRWADAGNTDAIVVVGMPAGPHKILIEIATPEHRVIAGQAVNFVVPLLNAKGHGGH